MLIGLGANLPLGMREPGETIAASLQHLAGLDVRPLLISPLYRSPAWPDPKDPPYVNAVATVQTGLSPQSLLELLQATERAFGRGRGTRNAPRTLDLDLLDYDGMVEVGPPILPHPRIADRAFVLLPLADIAPSWRHPVLKRSVSEMVAALPAADRAVTHVID